MTDQHSVLGHACQQCVIELHRTLLEADYLYAQQQDETTNQLVVAAQRMYYPMLLRYNHQTYTPDEARFRNATALWRRAKQNRKRLPDNDAWQEMAQHQEKRTRRLRAHAMALWDDYKPETQRILEREQAKQQNPPTPKPPRKIRVVHPLTRRYIYQEQE